MSNISHRIIQVNSSNIHCIWKFSGALYSDKDNIVRCGNNVQAVIGDYIVERCDNTTGIKELSVIHKDFVDVFLKDNEKWNSLVKSLS